MTARVQRDDEPGFLPSRGRLEARGRLDARGRIAAPGREQAGRRRRAACGARIGWRAAGVLCAAFLLIADATQAAQPVDVVFVLDNSGSMKTNDPAFLTRSAVLDFAEAMAKDREVDGRIALVLFDEQARLVQTLVPVDEIVSGDRLPRALASLDFSGQRTNSPAGVERALYELREHGRRGAGQAIVFLTDGRIDTGNPRNDVEAARWLREDLAGESEEKGIRIFGIAFADGGDYQLMQALARRTRARYYRAFEASELASVVDDVLAALDDAPVYDLAYVDSTPSADRMPDRPSATPSASTPDVAASPVEPARGAASGRDLRLLGWLPVALLLVGLGFWLQRRGLGPLARTSQLAPRAQLLDPGGQLGEAGLARALHREGRTTIGRDPRNDIVLPDDTVSSEHALIEVHDGRYWLIDLRSTNGTRHADRKLPRDERVPLKGGDHIRFADIDLMFVVEGYVPSGATVYLSSSTTPPADWSRLAESTQERLRRIRPIPDAPAPDAVAPGAVELDEVAIAFEPDEARAASPPRDARDAPSAEIVFAEQRERIDPASVVDLDQELGGGAAHDTSDRPAPAASASDAQDPVARAEGRADLVELNPAENDPAENGSLDLGAIARAEAALAAIEQEAADPSTRERARGLKLVPTPHRERETERVAERERAEGLTPKIETFDADDTPTAEVVLRRAEPPAAGSDAAPEQAAPASAITITIDALRTCLDYHLARVAEISPAFESFVDRAFTEELLDALPVAANDLLAAARESKRIEQREYTFDRVRFLICGIPGSMDAARDLFVQSYGGFTRLLSEQLQADSFRADRCEILALLSIGVHGEPWVSLTIVPDEGQDPRIDLLSYEFLTEAERREIEPSLDSEISQSGLA